MGADAPLRFPVFSSRLVPLGVPQLSHPGSFVFPARPVALCSQLLSQLRLVPRPSYCHGSLRMLSLYRPPIFAVALACSYSSSQAIDPLIALTHANRSQHTPDRSVATYAILYTKLADPASTQLPHKHLPGGP
jgi:hypothetical protein